MTDEWMKEFWESSRQYFRTVTEEVALEKHNGGGCILRSFFTTVRDGKGMALFESQFYEAQGEMPCLEIMVTPQFSITEGKLRDLEEVVMHLNYYTPLGAFGIHYPAQRLYLRHMLLMDGRRELKSLVGETGKVYETLGLVLGNVYGALERIATGKTDYEQEIRDGYLLRQG